MNEDLLMAVDAVPGNQTFAQSSIGVFLQELLDLGDKLCLLGIPRKDRIQNMLTYYA